MKKTQVGARIILHVQARKGIAGKGRCLLARKGERGGWRFYEGGDRRNIKKIKPGVGRDIRRVKYLKKTNTLYLLRGDLMGVERKVCSLAENERWKCAPDEQLGLIDLSRKRRPICRMLQIQVHRKEK